MPVDLLANPPKRGPRDLLADMGKPRNRVGAPDGTEIAPMGTGEDVVRSFGAGVRSGAEGLLAAPGALRDAGEAATSWVMRQLGVDEATAAKVSKLAYPFLAGAPSIQEVERGTEMVMGEAMRHDPQTTAGKYARTVGEFLPGAAVPGGIGVRTASVLVPAIASETAGQITEGTAAEPWARAIGGVAGGVGVGIRQAHNAARKAAQAAKATKTNAAINEAGEFGVPLTRGQAADDLGMYTTEENLRQVQGSAQPIMRRFDAAQGEAIKTAAKGIGQRLGSNPDDVVTSVPTGIRRYAATLQAKGQALYDEAFESGLMVKKEAVDSIPTFIGQKLDERGYFIDPVLTPVASKAIDVINDTLKMSGALRPRNPSTATGMATEAGEIAAINLQGLAQVRKRLNALQGNTAEDRAAMRTVKQAFDEWMDDAVRHSLYSGDESALKAYREANKTWAQFRAITNPKAGDSAGNTIRKMMADDATAVEVSNWLYGANIASPSANAPKVAARVKKMLGKDSQEWSSVRAAAWQRLTTSARDGEMLTATKAANNIEDFVNGKGRALANVLYTGDEREMMLRFARTLRRTTPPRDATNPSRSGYVMAKSMQGIMQALWTGLGSVAGGVTPVGSTMGAIVGAITQPVFRNIKESRAALKAINPRPMKVPNVPPRGQPALPAANAITVGGVNYLAPGGSNALAPMPAN